MLPAEAALAVPELLAPAGDWSCLKAAVASGADAVYFGLPKFNARMRADNFSEDQLPEVVRYLHKHGVKAYVTLNVLIFSDELPDAVQQLKLLESAGVDAVIVQDAGVAWLARELAPALRVHASTQMTVTSPEGAAFAESLGVSQIVLARELSIHEIGKFREVGVPLEVFVHGALCVAYSGQCLTSESLGQRSANRGECAQACRMPYELVVDGETVDLGEKRYLLSPQDLAAVEEIPDLVRAGVLSFKIEGRLKSPEYVAAVTAVYRRALDAAIAGEPFEASREDWYKLEMTFSRGLYPGWMHGVNHQELVGARYGKKRGHFLGHVSRTGPDFVEIASAAKAVAPKAGDGVVFENPSDTNAEHGGRIFSALGNRLTFGRGRVNLSAIAVGCGVWKTDDPALTKSLNQSFAAASHTRSERRKPMDIRLTGRAGEPMRAFFSMLGSHFEIDSISALDVAHHRPLETIRLREQFGKLKATPYELREFENALEGPVMLPLSAINRMRQAAVHYFDEGRQKISTPNDPSRSLTAILTTIASRPASPKNAPLLSVLVRSDEQADAALSAGAELVYLDFEDIRRYGDAVRRLRTNASETKLFLATPRIQKAGEQGFFKLIERAEPDGVLIRNLGALAFFGNSSMECVGDFSLNVANPISAAVFKDAKLDRVTASYDLTGGQVLALAKSLPNGWLEITIHQHMPMFHMEHCVFAAFMSDGKDFTDCGRPCEKHQVHLRDRVGIEHPLRADVGCRNTLFNASAQTGGKFFPQFFEAGIRHFRVELLEENAEETARVVSAYHSLLAGERAGDALWRDLKAVPQLGVTQGML